MQHWMLCELLVIASKHSSGLSYIDAHAMAPLARERSESKRDRSYYKFSSVQTQLPGQKSPYEQAWHRLAPRGGYPNSASFVKKIWNGDFSLLLCEIKDSTIEEIRPWLKNVRKSARCKSACLSQGDWRKRFEEGLPSPSETGLADDSLTLVSFDPYIYNRHRLTKRKNEKQKGNLYPDDIERALRAMNSLEGGFLIQLSTYDAQGNSQKDVIPSLNTILEPAFKLYAKVRVNGKMMSLVYARNVPWSAELADLSDRFNKWLRLD